MSWPEPSADCLGADAPSRSAKFAQRLQQHVQDSLTPDLALDLTLNELVVAAANATRASAGAVALWRGDDMVCRATMGDLAPDLGIPIHTRTGLSGACVRSRRPQNCRDTESDERVDAGVCRRLGIRSILVVPIIEGGEPAGIIEVFSPQTSAFAEADELQLQQFALDSLKLRQLSVEIAQRPPHELDEPVTHESSAPAPANAADRADRSQPAARLADVPGQHYPASQTLTEGSSRRTSTDLWTLVLATLVAVSALALLFLISYRTGWLRAFSKHPARVASRQPPVRNQNPPAAISQAPEVKTAKDSVMTSQPVRPAAPASGGLVIYERGKLVYRWKPTPPSSDLHPPPSVKTDSRRIRHVWLAPGVAEARLRDRVEPEYPAQARTGGRSGDVTLEILVRKDGSVASVRTLRGDPLLAQAAAAAVRNWHYDPYQLKGQPSEFQTDVTLKFSLSQ